MAPYKANLYWNRHQNPSLLIVLISVVFNLMKFPVTSGCYLHILLHYVYPMHLKKKYGDHGNGVRGAQYFVYNSLSV